MDVTLAVPGAGDTHKPRPFLERRNIAGPYISHRCPQAADQLMNDGCDRAFIGCLALNPLGYQFQGVRDSQRIIENYILAKIEV